MDISIYVSLNQWDQTLLGLWILGWDDDLYIGIVMVIIFVDGTSCRSSAKNGCG